MTCIKTTTEVYLCKPGESVSVDMDGGLCVVHAQISRLAAQSMEVMAMVHTLPNPKPGDVFMILEFRVPIGKA